MNLTRAKYTAAVSLIASVAITGAMMTAVPAQADTATGADVFLAALRDSGIGVVDEATAVRVGQSVCPLLVEPGQNAANVAAQVADAIGRPLGPATIFTGLAIQIFCPRAVTALTDGRPLSFFG
ncbi:DUF732 domain-containing protein [Mycobacterium sp. SMC-4]|uniref:DUF732 domain-containing protein n=1 Tax=Mycobacterium sp. SMC-4 TaxID=2857059 RepID=UPI0021B22B6A|nr:DUF732 domain-containing protein [Mycobacterium sp. SMC-4]UXA16812.1 DUF732 domain-containing protein [Mycobacterium sp. SMC-4]